jgi:RhtX/FptX family siderophore transporter
VLIGKPGWAGNVMNEQVMTKSNKYLFVVIGGLYLAQGIPMGLAFEAFPVLWRNGGLSLDVIALVPLAGLPWAIKFLWASFLENHWIDRIGRRKSWILPLHLLTAISLLAIAALPLSPDYAMVLIGLLAGVSLFSATQDIAIDALATERLSYGAYGNANALQTGGIMAGMLIGGPGSMLLVAALGYGVGLTVLALLVLLCVAPTLFWQEPEFTPRPQGQDKARIMRLFKRRGVWVMAGISFLIPLSGAVIFALIKLILVDEGWSLDKVGLASGFGNSFMILMGCVVAAWTIARFGTLMTISGGIVLLMLAALVWFYLLSGPQTFNEMVVWCVIPVGGVGIGMASVGSYTVMMRFASKASQPGTDYTLLHSAQIFGEVFISSIATSFVAASGYLAGLSLPMLCGAMTLLFILRFAGQIRAATHAD